MTRTQALDITLYYLKSLYGDTEGARIFAKRKTRIFSYHGLAWRLGKKSFTYFCNIFLYDLLFDYSGSHKPLSEAHYKIWDELSYNIINRNNTRNCYVFPRSFGKTNTITVPIVLWSALYCIHPLNVIDSATDELSDTIIATIKDQIEGNEYINLCFGEVINRNLLYNKSNIELDVKPNTSLIKSISITSSDRGITYKTARIGLLILDDSQSRKQTATDEQCNTNVSTITNGILMGLENSNNHVIALGTPQRKGDLYDTFLHSPIWESHTAKCILLDDIDYYFAHNQHWQEINRILNSKSEDSNAKIKAENYYAEHKEECQFPVIWNNYDCFALAQEYFANRVSFKQERQCDINSLGERRITSITTADPDKIERISFTNTILSIDPAATDKIKSDYSAFCVLSDTEEHIKYARKMIIEKLQFNEYIDMIIRLLLAYPDINTLSIEKQVYMGADVVKLREKIQGNSELKNRPLTIINKSRTRNKDNRIGAIIPDINMGGIVFNADDVPAIEQIKDFAGTAYTAHDDMIDALADAVENISASINQPLPSIQILDWSKYGL